MLARGTTSITSLLIGLTTGVITLSGCSSSYANSGRYTRTANDDIGLHPEAKQDIETLLDAPNNDATERAVLCIHSVYDAENISTSASTSTNNNAKSALDTSRDAKKSLKDKDTAAGDLNAKQGDISSFAFSVSKEQVERERARSCLKLCAPTPTEEGSAEVRAVAKKYSDRCRSHFGELRTMSAD